MNCTEVGVDIAKSVFKLHWVGAETSKIVRKHVKRSVFCLIDMEACGGAQH